jgi:hypothetical protein
VHIKEILAVIPATLLKVSMAAPVHSLAAKGQRTVFVGYIDSACEAALFVALCKDFFKDSGNEPPRSPRSLVSAE